MAEVELAQVSKVYDGGVRAVNDVSLTVRDREFLVLVGPSGCGKSTLLRMIAGLEDITAGTISIGGRAVNDVPPKDRDVAMVFQNYALYPHMTVEQNMAFGLKLRKLPRAEIRERIQTAAAMLAIDDLLKRKPRELSGGQRQRVAVGRAIVRQPAVFLFDEPLSNLDAQRRTEMRRELTDLHRRLAATIVYVTHDQVEAMTLGDRIVVMRDGDVQQVGPPLELYDRPANRFVAGFLGTPPMNFWEGQLRATADGVAFHSGEVAFALPVEPLDRWEKLNGGAVTFGLRSEHFHIVAAADSPSTFTAKVVDVQPLGGECLVYLDAAGQELILRTDTPSKVTRDQTVAIQADVEHAQIFAADGENLTIRA